MRNLRELQSFWKLSAWWNLVLAISCYLRQLNRLCHKWQKTWHHNYCSQNEYEFRVLSGKKASQIPQTDSSFWYIIRKARLFWVKNRQTVCSRPLRLLLPRFEKKFLAWRCYDSANDYPVIHHFFRPITASQFQILSLFFRFTPVTSPRLSWKALN